MFNVLICNLIECNLIDLHVRRKNTSGCNFRQHSTVASSWASLRKEREGGGNGGREDRRREGEGGKEGRRMGRREWKEGGREWKEGGREGGREGGSKYMYM